MSYHYTPCGLPTGSPSVNVIDLRTEYHPSGQEGWRFYIDGPLDAPELLPTGSVRYRASPFAPAPHPAFQTHIVHREH